MERKSRMVAVGAHLVLSVHQTIVDGESFYGFYSFFAFPRWRRWVWYECICVCIQRYVHAYIHIYVAVIKSKDHPCGEMKEVELIFHRFKHWILSSSNVD